MLNQGTNIHVNSPLNWDKFMWNADYIVIGVRQGYLDGMRIENLIRTSGLCASDQALLRAFCTEKGYIADESC